MQSPDCFQSVAKRWMTRQPHIFFAESNLTTRGSEECIETASAYATSPPALQQTSVSHIPCRVEFSTMCLADVTISPLKASVLVQIASVFSDTHDFPHMGSIFMTSAIK